jgi:cytochrome o ubiquinol oxidase subunit 2
MTKVFRRRAVWPLLPCLLLGGCEMVVLRPAGDIAVQQGQLVVISTFLMLLIIVPVIVLTLWFARRYRESNRDAPYDPDWDHSIQLELVIWAAPLVIILALGALTWIGTHTLDPYRPLSRIRSEWRVERDTRPLNVDVVALDWKWLFIYPDQGIATVNEMAAPLDTPINFRITATSFMNSFFVPAVAGQIYAMPGMETKLHAVVNYPGDYDGFSANYSGAGFSDMRFRFRALDPDAFQRWVQTAKANGESLSRERYLQLEKPSSKEPVRGFGQVAPGLFGLVVGRCVEPGTRCMHETMALDARRQVVAAAWPTQDPAAVPGPADVCTAENYAAIMAKSENPRE